MIRLMALILLATPAVAQEIVYSNDATEACLSTATDAMQCAGKSAGACMDANDIGSTTYGMTGCLAQELAFWDDRLNAAYTARMSEAKEHDKMMKEVGSSVDQEAPALLDMQRKWIEFRDAKCFYAMTQWGGGTGGGPASVSCKLQATAAQAIFLELSQMN